MGERKLREACEWIAYNDPPSLAGDILDIGVWIASARAEAITALEESKSPDVVNLLEFTGEVLIESTGFSDFPYEVVVSDMSNEGSGYAVTISGMMAWADMNGLLNRFKEIKKAKVIMQEAVGGTG